MKPNHLSLGTPLVSVIISSYNEGDWLKKTIDSILQNTSYPSFEVIVVDDASTDGSTDFFKKFVDYNPSVHCLSNATDQNWGVSRARHEGTIQARGDLFIFLDAHMSVDKGWIETIVQTFQNNRSIGLLAPMLYDLNHPEQKGRTTSYLYTQREISMWAPMWMNEIRFKTLTRVPFLNAAGLSIPRHVYEEIGGFPSWIAGWGPEDRCLSLLAYLYGYDAYRLPNLYLGHFFQENVRKNNPALAAFREKSLIKNCFYSCYIFYDDHDFDVALARLRKLSRDETENFAINELAQRWKQHIQEEAVRSYGDFVHEFEKYLPYRYATS